MKTSFTSHHIKSRLLALLLTGLACGPARGAAVQLQNATATLSQAGGWNVGQAIDGSLDTSVGWAGYNFAVGQARPETAVFETVTDAGSVGGSVLTFNLFQLNFNPQHTLGRFRLSVTTDNRNTFADGLANGGDVTANWTVLTR